MDFGGIVLHASQFRGSARIGRHKHSDAYVCFLVGGPLRERVGDRVWSHFPQTTIVHPAGEEHDDDFGGPALCVNLKISSQWIGRHLDDAGLWPERRAFENGPMFVLGLRLLHLYKRHELGLVPLDVEEIVAEFFFTGQSAMKHRPKTWRISRVMERLDSDPTTPARLSECANLVGVHPVYLARMFRKSAGMSLGEYQRHARLRRAISLLAGTRDPISLVALECGYSDQSHLTHVLKRHTGFTPLALRSCCSVTTGLVRRIQDPRLRQE